MDYKDFVEKKYPEPDKRMTKQDFPLIDELFVYGEDVPAPTVDELRCKYTSNERTPELVLPDDLIGYCVPPEGIVTVSVNGQGIRAGKGGWIYEPGTFREDRHTIGKELGVTNVELNLARHNQRKSAMIDAIAEIFEEEEELVLDIVKDKSTQVTAAVLAWAYKKVNESSNPREAMNFAKYFIDKVSHEEEVLASMTSKTVMSLEEAREWLEITKQAKEMFEQKGDIVELEFVEDDGVKE